MAGGRRTVFVPAVALLATLLTRCVPSDAQETRLFEDDFEAGLGKWTFPKGAGAALVDSEDPEHGSVLSLQTVDRIVVALMRGSDAWGDVRIEGQVLFPEDRHNYLGFVYRFQQAPDRTDFGSLYIKGNGSYIRANPHYDMNVGRTLFEEFRTPLTGPAAIEIGQWSSFALEAIGGEVHLYVGDLTRPQVTFPHYHLAGGAFGFKPRNPGGAVWLDNVSARRIDRFSYRGPALPSIEYRSPALELKWDVLGPLTRFAHDVETSRHDPGAEVRDAGRSLRWRAFRPDSRGAVISGTVIDYEGPRRVAYFHAQVESEVAQDATLSLSTVDDLSIWVNGRFQGFVSRGANAWWDAWMNPEHANDVGTVRLEAGENHLLVRVVGGIYASGGFFLRLVP